MMLIPHWKFSKEAAQPDHPTENTLKVDQAPPTCSELPIRCLVPTLKYEQTTKDYQAIWKISNMSDRKQI